MSDNTEKLVKRSQKIAFMNVGTKEAPNYQRMRKFTDISTSKNAKEYNRQYVDEECDTTDVVGYSEQKGYAFDQYTNNPVHEKIVNITDNELTDDDIRLIIAGEPISEEYGKELKLLIRGNEKIIYEPRFMSVMELDSLIALFDIVLIPYAGQSSMNSGVLIKALSNGKAVIAPDICMVRDINTNNDFLYRWERNNIETLKEQMARAYYDGKTELSSKGENAKQYVDKHNNSQIVKRLLEDLLEQTCDLEIGHEIELSDSGNCLEHEVEWNAEGYLRYQYLFKVMCQWMNQKNEKHKISEWIRRVNWNKVAIYGMGNMGKALLKELEADEVKVLYGIDRNAEKIEAGIPVYRLTDKLERVDGIIVTAITFYEEIERELQNELDIPVVSLKDILDEIECLND